MKLRGFRQRQAKQPATGLSRVEQRIVELEASLASGPFNPAMASELRTLWQLRSALTQQTRVVDWRLLAMVLVSLAIVSVLLFVRMPDVEVSFDLEATGLRLKVPSRQVLFEPLQVTSVSVAGFDNVSASPGSIQRVVQTRAISALVLQAAELPASMTFPEISIPAGAEFDVQWGGVDREWTFTVRTADSVDVRVVVTGGVVLRAGDSAQTLALSNPEQVLLSRRGQSTIPVDVRVAMAGEAATIVRHAMAFSGIRMSRASTAEVSGRRTVRSTSDVVGGTLTFDSLNGTARELHSGERLHFEEFSGVVERIQLGKQTLHATMRGTAKEITVGRGSREVSLMPTVLDWLQAQRPLLLMWTAVLYVFGLLQTGYRWWQGRPR